MKRIALALCLYPAASLAVGSDNSTPPPKTETTKTCAAGLVWEPSVSKCLAPKDARLTDDQRFAAVRELAYAGQLAEAQAVLAQMADQSEGRVLTYWGFTHARLGAYAAGFAAYQAAIAQDPDNLLARSYMGQAHVARGEMTLALVQLREIRARGGAAGWPAQSLSRAIRTGEGYAY